jgi:nicotinamide mononucleotide (NMN) deamidase PncC
MNEIRKILRKANVTYHKSDKMQGLRANKELMENGWLVSRSYELAKGSWS